MIRFAQNDKIRKSGVVQQFVNGWLKISRRIIGAVDMKRSEDFLLKKVGGQDLLVPLGAKVMDMNSLITLNVTGRYVWELLAADCSVEYLVAGVAEHFDVNQERARADVQAFLDELGRLGLLETR
jgi:hypothetical protein